MERFRHPRLSRMAQQLGLSAISITDHDTLAGTKEALNVGIPSSLGFITGVEISTDPPPPFLFPAACIFSAMASGWMTLR